MAGTFLLMWVTMAVYPVVDRGHYRSAAWVIFPMTLGISFALHGRARAFGFSAALFELLFLVAVYSQRPLLEWSAGVVGSIAGMGTVMVAATSSCLEGCAMVAANAALGGLMVGSVTHAMVLGHWYLNQPRLPIEPLVGATRIMLGAAAAAIAGGVAGRGALVSGQVAGSILAFSGSGYWWAWLVLMAGTLILGTMVRSTVRSRSTQSATGLLYVAIIPALVAQFVLNLLALP